jgi:hypothetical protein
MHRGPQSRDAKTQFLKAPLGVPIAIGMGVKTKRGEKLRCKFFISVALSNIIQYHLFYRKS